MSLVVNTNVGSLNAQRSLAASGAELKTAMERLSSGKKINSAADDAAGFAIAERMTAQIRGLNMATKNANDGLSMLAVIENATNDVTDMLQRMRELAVQAANDTNSATDRGYLQKEADALLAEINRVATQTQYNGQTVLDGTYQNKTIQVGTDAGQTVTVSVAGLRTDDLANQFNAGDGDHSTLEHRGFVLPHTFQYSRESPALSADGETLVVGTDSAYGPYTNVGKVEVYEWNMDQWVPKGSSISPPNPSIHDNFGRSVSISQDGETVAVGAIYDEPGSNYPNDATGSVFVFDWNGDNWQQRGAPVHGGTLDFMGASVVLTNDGNTFFTGLTGDVPSSSNINLSQAVGSVQAYDWNGDSWEQRGDSVFGNLDYGYFGESLAASSDGNSVLAIGRNHQAHVISWSGDEWITKGQLPTSLDMEISAASMSSDGNTIMFSRVADIHSGSNLNIDVEVYNWDGEQWIQKGHSVASSVSASGRGIATMTEDGSRLAILSDHGRGVTTDATLEILDWDGESWVKTTETSLPSAGNSWSNSMSFSANGQILAAVRDDGVHTMNLAPNRASLQDIDLVNDAGGALSFITMAIDQVSGQRAEYGALQNRLEHTVSNLMNVSEFTTAARSRIEDADFAAESARLAKAQVLQQTGAAMLAQANASPQLALSLIR